MKNLASFALVLLCALGASAQYDTIIVGGGLSGLAAAVELQKPKDQEGHKGQNVLVVESTDRLGGRVRSVEAYGLTIENGAEFIDRENKNLQDLIRRYRLELIELDKRPERMIFSFGGRTYSLAELSEKIFSENEQAIQKIQRLRTNPSLSIAKAMEFAGFNEFAKSVFSTVIGSETGRNPAEIAFSEFGNYFFAFDSKKRLIRFLPYADESFKLKGGTERLVQALAADLKPGTVALNMKVTAVKTVESGFELTVETPAGARKLSARELVITVPAKALKAIRFDIGPRGEAAVRQLTGMPYAQNSKLYLFFSRKRWLEMGLSGAGWSEKGFQFFESSQGQGAKTGAILAYSGEPPRTGAERAELIERTLGELDRIFPGLRKDYIGHRLFQFPRSYSVQGLIGAPSQSAFLKAARDLPFRLIGEGFSTESPGYMDGAVETGLKAAREILRRSRPSLNRCARAVSNF